MPPSAPQDAQDNPIWSKKSPQDLPRPPLDLDFNTILTDFLWNFEGLFVILCFPLFSFALLCFALLYWINNQSPALSRQCLHTPTTSSKQCFFTGTVAGDAKHLGYNKQTKKSEIVASWGQSSKNRRLFFRFFIFFIQRFVWEILKKS